MDKDTISITLPTDTTSKNSLYDYTGFFSTSTVDTITIPSYYNGSSISTVTFDDNWFGNWSNTIPFVNGFPEWDDFEKMRKEYPALDKAYENLKTIHKLCEAEWEGKKKEDNDRL